MKLTVIGLSITSSWGNGHATTFRALLKAFSTRGHSITFLEREVPYYANNRDLKKTDYCSIKFYKNLSELRIKLATDIENADAVMVGSYIQEGVMVNDIVFSLAKGIKIFYDIDTPVTLAKIAAKDYQYIHPHQIRQFDLYLSFSGGSIPDFIMDTYRAPLAKPLYCSVDIEAYYPEEATKRWQMGYLGTYSPDRQPTLEKLLNQSAINREEDVFVVAGPQYPKTYKWASNIQRINHVPPQRHCSFYNAQKYTLNVTRKKMIAAGYSPSVRLFEAAACAVPIISDYWRGLDSFFEFNSEILIAKNTADVLEYWENISTAERKSIGEKARNKVLQKHTSLIRAKELEHYIALLL